MELSLSATDITSGTRHPPSLCHLLRGSIGLFFSETSLVTDRENTPFCRFVTTTFRAIFLFFFPFYWKILLHEINIRHFASRLCAIIRLTFDQNYFSLIKWIQFFPMNVLSNGSWNNANFLRRSFLFL